MCLGKWLSQNGLRRGGGGSGGGRSNDNDPSGMRGIRNRRRGRRHDWDRNSTGRGSRNGYWYARERLSRLVGKGSSQRRQRTRTDPLDRIRGAWPTRTRRRVWIRRSCGTSRRTLRG